MKRAEFIKFAEETTDKYINEIFASCQDKVGIKDGDIEPLLSLRLSKLQNDLVEIIELQLKGVCKEGEELFID